MKKTIGTVRVKDLRLSAIIGVYEWEKKKKQDILINYVAEYDASKAAESDNIHDAMDYWKLTDEIIEKVEATEFDLLEKLVDFVLDIIMSRPMITKAYVEIDKPDAIPRAESASVSGVAER